MIGVIALDIVPIVKVIAFREMRIAVWGRCHSACGADVETFSTYNSSSPLLNLEIEVRSAASTEYDHSIEFSQSISLCRSSCSHTQ